MWQALLNVLVPVFITVGIGYLWVRMKLEIDPAFISRIVINVGSPALAFYGLTTMKVSGDLFARMSLVAGLTLVAMMAANWLMLRARGLSLRDWLHPLTFPNWGNLGLPLCYFAYGDTGLTLAIAFYAVSSASQLTIGVLMASGQMKPVLLMRMPMVYAIGLALMFLYAGVTPPTWMLNTADLISGLMMPMMLLALGASLASLKVTHFRETLSLVVYRYVLGIGAVYGIARLVGLEGEAMGVALIQGAMPIAVLNYLLAARFNNQPQRVASLVVLSTLLSLAIIPLLLGFLL
ncbi:AEC family transporter [Govanella unica]|uniref:AEC family transporter n=1 Tax=Govanella unica TaxID=2975056 RepID=A0A9X3TUV1_9PROT|nr:AEC family transporter [Govania unica]MDA5192560.1 AEC family transporter [Govania unica]